MFSRSRSGGRGGRHNFGRPKKESNKKKHHVRTWVFLPKKRNHHHHHHEGVLMSGDSPPPLQASLPSSGFETPNDVHNGKITPISSIQKSTRPDVDVEDIEEAVPIIHKTLPVPEPKPPIEKNGADYYDVADGKQLVHDVDDDPCVIKCLYFTQQCCECTIL